MKLYLDSNIYIKAKYIFYLYKLGNIKELISSGKVTLLYTSITFREVEEHMVEDCDLAVNGYNKNLRKDILPYGIDKMYNINEIDSIDAITKFR